MLKMSVDTEVLLSEQDFSCFVLDDWDWKQKFLTSSRDYSVRAASIWNPSTKPDLLIN